MGACLEAAEKMQARAGTAEAAPIYAAGETHFASSQAMLLELYADAYALLRARGEGATPVAEKQFWHELAGVHRFDAGQFVVLRTEHSLASFSYGSAPMGSCCRSGKICC
jgi:hypothetical protein